MGMWEELIGVWERTEAVNGEMWRYKVDGSNPGRSAQYTDLEAKLQPTDHELVQS